MMKLLSILALFAGAAFAQCGSSGTLVLNPVTGLLDCTGKASSGGSGVTYCAPASASSTTYTCTPSPVLASYAAGATLAFVPDVAGAGGATTVNVSALGAKSVKLADGSTNPASTDLVPGRVYLLTYDGTNFRIAATILSGAVGNVLTYTANHVLALADCSNYVVMNGATLTLTLTSPPPANACSVRVMNLATGSALTVSRNGLTINAAAADLTVAARSGVTAQSATIFTDGTNWYASTVQ